MRQFAAQLCCFSLLYLHSMVTMLDGPVVTLEACKAESSMIFPARHLQIVFADDY